MKTTLRTKIATASMAVAAICVFGTNLQAQTFKVPFDFQATRGTLPAGDYRIEHTSTSGALLLHNNKTGEGMYVVVGQPTPTPYAKRPCIVFHRYGNEIFLAEIWAGEGLNSKVPVTSREKELRIGSKQVVTILLPLGVRAD